MGKAFEYIFAIMKRRRKQGRSSVEDQKGKNQRCKRHNK